MTAICQIRLDFDAFNLAITSGTGACSDILAITSGSGQTLPSLCGANVGEHIYFDTGRVTTAQVLTFTVASSVTFKAKVQQIECGVNYK